MMEEEEETLFDQEGLLGHKEEVAHERRERKRKILKTAALSMSFFCLGLCIAIPGPTLLDLGKRVGTDTEHMTFIFTARSIGYLIGALAGGILSDFFNQQILLFYTISAAAVATASIPWCTALLSLSVFICVQGVALGVLDTGGNVFCIKIWGHKSAPFMQVLHFAFGIGAFLAPLIAQPFLMDTSMVSENMTRMDFYPVNFKVPSLPFSAHKRFVRDTSHLEFLNKDYIFDLEAKLSSLNLRSIELESNAWLSLVGQTLTGDVISDATSQKPKSFHHVDSDNFIDKHAKAKSDVKKLLDGGKDSLYSIPKQFDYGLSKKHSSMESSDPKLLDTRKSSTDSKSENFAYDLNKEQIGLDSMNLKLFKSEKNFSNSKTVQTDFETRSGTLTSSQILDNVVIFRAKREVTVSADTENSTISGNNTELSGNDLGIHEDNVTSTLAPPTTPARASKPGFNNGDDLSQKHADAAEINKKLQGLIDNPPQNIPVLPAVTTTITSTTNLDVNTTYLGNASWVNIDSNSSSEVNNSTSLAEEASTQPTTTVSMSTVTTTTIPSTTVLASTTSRTTFIPPSTLASSPKTTTTIAVELVTKPEEALDEATTTNSSTGKTMVTKSVVDDDIVTNIFYTFVGMSKIQVAYSLIGMLLVINAGLYIFLYCKDRMLAVPSVTRSHEDMTRTPDTKCFVSTLIILLFFFFFAYMGMEVTFGGLLTTFVVYYPVDHWTPAQAATLTALFWGCLALGRCFGIFTARCFKPPCMMIANLSLTLLGAVLLSFAVKLSSAMLWVGTITLGLGMSSLFPTAISWANSYYPLTGRATAVFVAGSGIGEMIIPMVTGYLYENVIRMSLMYMTLALSVLLSVLYLNLQLLVYQKGRSSPRRSHSGFMRLNNSDDMAEAVDMDTTEFVVDDTTDISETLLRRRVQEEEERRKPNGDSYMTTEFTKLVELSD